jgi:RNA polymerase sigma-70 factor (ECF subfamily)
MDASTADASRSLSEAFDHGIDAAEAVWPTCALDRDTFKEHVLSILARAGGDPIAQLSTLHLTDLYLAQACFHRRERAVQLFASRFLGRVEQYIGRLQASVAVDDVRRELEDTLLVGRDGAPPRLGQYTGRGPLVAFVASAARRVALTLVRRRRVAVPRQLESVTSQLRVESATKPVVASRYEGAIRDAIRDSLSVLDPRGRTIVRLHLYEGISLTQIARMLRVHQSTISRSLDAALKRLYCEVRRRLREAHGLNEAEIRSIVSDLQSHVDLSLSRILQSTKTNAR